MLGMLSSVLVAAEPAADIQTIQSQFSQAESTAGLLTASGR